MWFKFILFDNNFLMSMFIEGIDDEPDSSSGNQFNDSVIYRSSPRSDRRSNSLEPQRPSILMPVPSQEIKKKSAFSKMINSIWSLIPYRKK